MQYDSRQLSKKGFLTTSVPKEKLFQKNANVQNEECASVLLRLKTSIALPSCPSKFPSRILANTDALAQLLQILNESPIVLI